MHTILGMADEEEVVDEVPLEDIPDEVEEVLEDVGEETAEVTKMRKKREIPKPEETINALRMFKKGAKHLKERVNVRQNKKYFEVEAREVVKFEIILASVEKLIVEHKRLVVSGKRDSKPRYLLPVARKFVEEHPLSESVKTVPPTMPRLSKGKGVGSSQMLSAYLYGYLGEKCTRVGRQEYGLDEAMKGLVLAVVGEDLDILKFGGIRRICMACLVSGVEVLEKDVNIYKEVLEYYLTQRKPVKIATVEDAGNGEEVEEVVEEQEE